MGKEGYGVRFGRMKIRRRRRSGEENLMKIAVDGGLKPMRPTKWRV